MKVKMLCSQVISHSDGFTKNRVYTPHISLSLHTSECESWAICASHIWLWICVQWSGANCGWRHTTRHFYHLVNSYLHSPHKHNCASVCKKRAPFWWESGTVIKKGKFMCMGACVCVHFLSMGRESRLYAAVAYGVYPGDEPVSSLLCAYVWVSTCRLVCVCLYFTLMTICALLFKEALSAWPMDKLLRCFSRWHPNYLLHLSAVVDVWKQSTWSPQSDPPPDPLLFRHGWMQFIFLSLYLTSSFDLIVQQFYHLIII